MPTIAAAAVAAAAGSLIAAALLAERYLATAARARPGDPFRM